MPARARFATLAVAALAAPLVAAPATAQVIQIKTVPVATGDQFLVFPSDRLGMGSVSIALTDTLGDPFANPATLARLPDGRVFGAPLAYGISGNNGGAMTLPVGGLFGTGAWRGGIGVALQELDRGGQPAWFGVLPGAEPPPSPDELSQRSRTNLYGYAAVARRLGDEGGPSVGLSVLAADLTAMAGVDLLYGAQTVDQRGYALDLRLGVAAEPGPGETFEATVLHTRLDMRHDLFDVVWGPIPVDTLPQDQWPWGPEVLESTERDRTNAWGLHLNYVRPLAADGWRVGGIFTANYKAHPKIPNYTLMSIPRDPGDSWAYDIGVGLSRHAGDATFGVDVIYEPVWTETWADAAGPVETASGATIPTGDMTVFNDFRFRNAIVRMGVEGQAERVTLQFGLQVKAYRYTLDQTDFVLETERTQHEGWMEWTPSLALGFRFDEFAIHYTGRVTSGTGRPGVSVPWGGLTENAIALAAGGDFLPAPSGALTLQDATVHTHGVTVSIPFGR